MVHLAVPGLLGLAAFFQAVDALPGSGKHLQQASLDLSLHFGQED